MRWYCLASKGSRARHKRRSWHGLGVLIALLKRVQGRWGFYSSENRWELGPCLGKRASEWSLGLSCAEVEVILTEKSGDKARGQPGSMSIGGPRWAFVVRRTRDSRFSGVCLEPRLLPSWQFALIYILDRRLSW